MNSREPTSTTLLIQLRERQPEAWTRVVQLYGPLVAAKCRRAGIDQSHAEDILQEVFSAIARALPGFRHDRQGDTFRGWVATITQNKIRDHFRRSQKQPGVIGGSGHLQCLNQHPDSPQTGPAETDPDDEKGLLVRRAAELVRCEFEEKTWMAFWLTTAEGFTPATAAEKLNTTVNAVYHARSRVLRRLRQEFEGLL